MDPLPSVKRKKSQEDLTIANPSKKARKRVSYSCGECHRRKQKCDRQVPCSHCVSRKVPELCKAYSPGKPEQDVHSRLARIEAVLEAAVPQLWSQSDHNYGRQSTSPGVEDDTGIAEGNDNMAGVFYKGSWLGSSAVGSIASPIVLEQINHITDFRESAIDSSFTTNGRLLPFATQNAGVGGENSAADKLNTLIQDCGVSPHKIPELLQELPPKKLMDDLIDYYFDHINWTRYPLPESDFRTSVAAMCSSNVTVAAGDLRFLPLLFVVLAIAARLAPERLCGDVRNRRLTSQRYYWSSRRSLLVAVAIQPNCLEMIWTRLLSARFLTFDRRITEFWSQLGAAVSTAQSLGLHSDPSVMRLDRKQAEYRRRIWSHLYHADRWYALILGRPMSILDEFSSTLPPLNLDYDMALPMDNPPPLTSPTPMTFVLLRHRLARVMGGIVHHFQQVQKPTHYSEVLKLDDELAAFLDSLPPHFSYQPDKSLDDKLPFLVTHRFLLLMEVMFIKITLHRPYLLRSDRYIQSRNACFDATMKYFNIRQDFREFRDTQKSSFISTHFREFPFVMIAAIYLILNPSGSDTPTMKAVVDVFLKDHQDMQYTDDTTVREVKTIEFLKSKAAQRADAVSGDATRSSEEPPNDAHLLLGLQRSKIPNGGAIRNITQPNTPTSTSTQRTSTPLLANMFALQASPASGGSPEEDLTAQSLLDHWCNSISASSLMDESGVATGLPWNMTLGADDQSGWLAQNSLSMVSPQPWTSAGAGSDLSYWQTLVDQIKPGSSIS